MIVVDLSNVVYASVFVETTRSNAPVVDKAFLSHLILNQIKSYNKKFNNYGEMVLCLDSHCPKGNWRKQVFTGYKACRKAFREASLLDWGKIFADISEIISEMREVIPYKILEIDELEADDIIAILTKTFSQTENVLIISNDKDFKQLHNSKVKQYFPRNNIALTCDNPKFELLNLIVHGDKVDGVPNIRSDIDSFLGDSPKKQKAVKAEYFKKIIHEGVDWLPDNEKRRFKENEILISFDKIPKQYYERVLNIYSNTTTNVNQMKFLQYLSKYKLNEIINDIGGFYLKNGPVGYTTNSGVFL